MTYSRTIAVMTLPALISLAVLIGFVVGFLWHGQSNAGTWIAVVSAAFAVLSAFVQLAFLRPRLALSKNQRIGWTLLVVSPLFLVLLFAELTGWLYVLVLAFMTYIKRHGV
jgi:hypothetical protein